MSRQALLPRTAPFGDQERAHLDAALGAATPIQRAWLAGFLAGLDAAAGQSGAAAVAPAAPPKAAEPLTILFASESGNSEKLASDVGKLARKQGFKPKIVDFADLDLATLPKTGKLVAIVATWGEGEPPARAVRAYGELMSDAAPRLEGVEFGVLALGDTSYAEFCAIGKALDARFEALGAKRAYDRADLDLDFEKPAADWIKGALKALAPADTAADNVVAVDFRGAAEDEDGEVSREPRVVEVIDHVNLNSSRSDKETIHLALEFEDGAPAYEPGDSLEIFPENDPQLVDEILRATGLTGDEGLRRALLAERDITTLSPTTVERFAKATGHADAQKFVESGEVKAWIEGRHLIDLIERFPAELTAEHLNTVTRPLPPRAYSIASSRKEVGDEVHLTIAAVRYETHGRARSGVASVHVADRIKNGAKLRVRVKPNKHFRLPADPATDIIMVGPGTGVAPFRAFVQERRATEASGRSWLFFGDRHFTHDFLYQLEWQDALEDGSLSKIDVAFSRDQPEKIYVQDRIDQHAAEVVAWLDGGAHFYVCGDAKNMARDVRAAVVRAFESVKGLSRADAEAHVASLERAKRYQQDVY
ncbi:flavodoxin domain-containing protein [Methylorubrum rhodesianum]|uniref:Sulfite reductase [NADPH] flavoprotein alpha-component n=1 Tax=Methylorubrum rhodesianum TaxID=29427 RepID=A0ABU9ZBJ1_9HYPH|nr:MULTISPECIES: flavodoxin domain-containing protein [Methylorubrum]MBB5763895.1 sulfite reductase (NADPH) flavoprotein alpha-component [Methylorubrum rhodesianum]MBI1690326.1 sulfite reductase subunit alpha [Methylorubrum sp. DB1722]MBK3401580.1 flavodoxin domain-containing protein [Methylorubrum rhodesianum]MBY0141963.1 flavodoxin domain-containing protein [Methylorubrum populi]